MSAAAYGAAVVPARAGHPRDKAVVEASVLVAQRWILAILRHRPFFSLAKLNAAVWDLLPGLNVRPMRRLGVSRRALFEQLDRPLLRPLPTTRYEVAECPGPGLGSAEVWPGPAVPVPPPAGRSRSGCDAMRSIRPRRPHRDEGGGASQRSPRRARGTSPAVWAFSAWRVAEARTWSGA